MPRQRRERGASPSRSPEYLWNNERQWIRDLQGRLRVLMVGTTQGFGSISELGKAQEAAYLARFTQRAKADGMIR